ncbi:MAG: hypothetical protein AVDCRST_MAG77-1223 [uncultured Chloroflexi bacterium]|uniref:DUF1772 domain-containing protein n=1 Tax=uncultured Chloroflexota bacterium TaxID=166587 RepID=A0A6J4HW68_9CHLR|nr:MAG: hypothetical protein AVDCRST_MAG77-1223 [uncultured Chloroflexota bacterium]
MKVVRFVNLLLAGVLVGNEFGGWVAVHPALATLPIREHVAAERAVTKRYKAIMPYVMTATIASGLLVLGRLARRRSTGQRWQLAGTSCFGAMLAVTLLGNMPINHRILAAVPEALPADWYALRARWDRLHTVRNVLNVTGFGCLILSTLAGDAAGDTAAATRP